MTRSGSLRTVLEVTVLLLLVAMIVGQVFGQPVVLGFVTSDSMEPTLDPGDGFVAVPQAVAGPVEEGDVIVFRAEELQGGGLTTHRVVGETDRGYVTRGDGNPFTDQDAGEPPVKDPQIVAEALQIGGTVVVIPHLGTAVQSVQTAVSLTQGTLATVFNTGIFLGTRGLAYLFFAASVLLYAADALRGGRDRGDRDDRDDRDRSRDTGIDTRLIVAGFALLLVVGATAAMVGPGGTEEYGVISADSDSDRPLVIPTGESESITYRVGNGGVLPVVSYLEPESEMVSVRPEEARVPPGETVNATVTLRAPTETGYYRLFLTEHRYLAVLPGSAIRALYEVHPWAPILAIDALIAVPFYFVGVTLVGSGRIRRRSRSRDLPTITRVRRAVRSLYR